MDIYTDYLNWKFENHELIDNLVKRRSKTISRFTSTIVVVDYLYDKYVKYNKLSADEEVFFSSGFDYIHDNFYTIKTILEFQFNNDYNELEKCAKTINLLLYINEFQAELLQSIPNPDEIKPLDELENIVNTYLDKKENAPDELFQLLNEIVNPIFDRYGIEFNPIESIFYEVALEYKIYKENEFDIYNAVFNLEKAKNKK